MTRDRDRTRGRIIESLGRQLAEQGFQGIGVNAVARAAGVDKVLIYRYFGGLSQLLQAYAEGELQASPDEPTESAVPPEPTPENALALSRSLLIRHLRRLREQALTQEIMRWELVQRNDLTDVVAGARERIGLTFLDQMKLDEWAKPDMDLPAVGALLHAGITYLILRSKTADQYLGVDLRTESGWQRLERAIDALLKAFFEPFMDEHTKENRS